MVERYNGIVGYFRNTSNSPNEEGLILLCVKEAERLIVKSGSQEETSVIVYSNVKTHTSMSSH